MKKAIFTIETWRVNSGLTTYYLDLMSDLSFSVTQDEHLLINSKDPNDCIRVLKDNDCICSENYNYTYLA